MSETVISCRVVKLDHTDEAECAMVVGGYELQHVGFPSRVLRDAGLAEGDHFCWTVRDPENVCATDVERVTPPPDAMTPERAAELYRLYKEFERDVEEDGGKWPVYTGDGE